MPLRRGMRWVRNVLTNEKRREGALRLVGGAVYYIIVLVIGWLFFLVYAAVWVIDSLLQTVFGVEAIGDDNLASRAFDRQQRLREYLLFGRGDADDWRR